MLLAFIAWGTKMKSLFYLVLIFIFSPAYAWNLSTSCSGSNGGLQFDNTNGWTCGTFPSVSNGTSTWSNGTLATTGTGVIFSQTSTVTYANSTTETNLVGTGIGTVTLPANFWTVGRQVRVKGRGFYSSNTLAPSLTLKSKFGSTVLATAAAANLLNSASNAGFSFEQIITCRSTGSSGTLQVDGSVSYATGTGLLGASYLINITPGTIDTTLSQALGVTGTWGIANAANTMSVTNVSVEVLN